MKAEITGITNGPCGDWKVGEVEDYDFMAKLADLPTKFGIDGLHVIKLVIKPKDQDWSLPLVNYDRGWDVRPSNDYEKSVYEAALAALEESARQAEASLAH